MPTAPSVRLSPTCSRSTRSWRWSADTLDRALVLMAGLEPDVAVIDPRLPDGDGLDLCPHLQASGAGTRCLILTCDTEPDAMLAAVEAGAAGYIVEDLTDLAPGRRGQGPRCRPVTPGPQPGCAA
ncbi:response regulator [Nocardia sp. NPDC051981]|uniref:response regulator n=1 Tax=Nocardia sp. NPDC051981 TaxID=3155417 RepID=UPI00341ADC57